METNKAFLKQISINAYNNKSGLNGLILGVAYVTPEGLEPRPCYKVQYYKPYGNSKRAIIDDIIDYVPISDVLDGAYEIVDKIRSEVN